uniref:LITAF domain-containing protein n=1 Tax=Steinernema glaseri TaxID=37863 RepID=A0A1I7ZZ93_9BILA
MSGLKRYYSDLPKKRKCPKCEKTVRTTVRYKWGWFSCLVSCTLCSIGCCCSAWMPFFAPDAQDAFLHCPDCGHLFGAHIKLDICVD